MGNSIQRMVKFWQIILFLIIGAIVGFQIKGCLPGKVLPGKVITKTDTIPGDSIPYPIYIGVPQPYKVIEYKEGKNPTLEEKIVIDTPAFFKDCLAIRYFSDTMHNDTSYHLVINEGISRNTIVSRDIQFQNLRPVSINTIVQDAPEPQYSLSAGVFYYQTFGAVATFKNNRISYGAGIDLDKKGLFKVEYELFRK